MNAPEQAMQPPRPLARRFCLAAMIAARLPRAVASARADVGPTCRIDNATRIRHSGRSLASCRFASSRAPLADSTLLFVVKN